MPSLIRGASPAIAAVIMATGACAFRVPGAHMSRARLPASQSLRLRSRPQLVVCQVRRPSARHTYSAGHNCLRHAHDYKHRHAPPGATRAPASFCTHLHAPCTICVVLLCATCRCSTQESWIVDLIVYFYVLHPPITVPAFYQGRRPGQGIRAGAQD